VQYLFIFSVTLLITIDYATIEKPYASIVSFANSNTFSLVLVRISLNFRILFFKSNEPSLSLLVEIDKLFREIKVDFVFYPDSLLNIPLCIRT